METSTLPPMFPRHGYSKLSTILATRSRLQQRAQCQIKTLKSAKGSGRSRTTNAFSDLLTTSILSCNPITIVIRSYSDVGVARNSPRTRCCRTWLRPSWPDLLDVKCIFNDNQNYSISKDRIHAQYFMCDVIRPIIGSEFQGGSQVPGGVNKPTFGKFCDDTASACETHLAAPHLLKQSRERGCRDHIGHNLSNILFPPIEPLLEPFELARARRFSTPTAPPSTSTFSSS